MTYDDNHEFCFDVKLEAVVRVLAASESEAVQKMREQHEVHVGLGDGVYQIAGATVVDFDPKPFAVDGNFIVEERSEE